MATFNRDALWEKGQDESVQVNQRALIDKVLARYSGEFTVFRELLQNSDDAASKRVEIHFQTKEHDPAASGVSVSENQGLNGHTLDMADGLNTAAISKWIFKNDGMLFREEDWNRLKKIAEGNPDEDKIGAFGVGFYSLFSVTEEPFVTSGENWMGFYWKGDQLVARRGQLEDPTPFPEDESPRASMTSSTLRPPWTTFEMPLREPSSMPKAFDFIQFLCSSLTFMSHLSSVSVYLNNTRLALVSKSASQPKIHVLPKTLKTRSETRLTTVTGIESTSLMITADVLGAVYTAGSEKPAKSPMNLLSLEDGIGSKLSKGNFFSSFFSSFKASTGSLTPLPDARSSTPSLAPKEKVIDPNAVLTSSIVLTIYSAHAAVSLDKKLSDELYRSTKKNPPKNVVYSLIYTGKDAYDASLKEDQELALKTGSVFQGLRADLDGTGTAKVFIGHATGQTTGIGGHMAARFIPTVERESIDLIDKNVAVWNKELLYVGGYLSRAVYEYEMEDVKALWMGSLSSSSASPSSLDSETRIWLQNRCLHAMLFFSFHISTPSNVVSHLLESSFYQCPLDPPSFPIISTTGVQEVRRVRLYDVAYTGFIRDIFVIPPEVQITLDRPKMLTSLRGRELLRGITLADVLHELRNRPLAESEMVECIKWWFALDMEGLQSYSGQLKDEFLGAAVVSIRNGDGPGVDRVLPLSSIRHYVSQQTAGSVIPLDDQLPLPLDTFPYSLSKQLPNHRLLQSSFGWTALDLPKWLAHILNLSAESGMDESLALKILQVLARSWGSLDASTKEAAKVSLAERKIVPTRNGLKQPAEAYFPTVDIFPDLPVITISGAKGKAMDQMLEFLGVRKHVELQLIFSRMYKTGDWGTADLIKYLASIRTELSEEEMDRLRKTEAFLEEAVVQDSGIKPNGDIDKKLPVAPAKRHTASSLFEPTDSHRALGLPVLDWGSQQRWRSNSVEATFLFDIGLKRHPTTLEILNLSSSFNPNVEQRALAFQFFIDHYESLFRKTYIPSNFHNLPFVPALEAGGAAFLGKPSEVFVNPEAAIFGFSVVQPHLREGAADKLQLQKNPPTEHIVKLLRQSAPGDVVQANRWFEALSNRTSEFTDSQRTTLTNTAFIPQLVRTAKGTHVVMYRPGDCYLNTDNAAKFHSQLFIFVDFSDKASHFLRSCGIKDAPSTQEIAQILVADPHKFLEKAGDRESFLSELRNLAVNQHRISGATLAKMSRTSSLLGLRKLTATATQKNMSKLEELEDYDDDWQYVHELALPKNIVIVDDTSSYALFAELLLSAPQEDLLEEFYSKRGSPRLSSLIQEEYHPSGTSKDKTNLADFRSLVLSRLSLFLHEHSHTRSKVEFSWLSKENNFIVQEASRIQLTKHLRFNGTRASRNLDASAAAIRSSRNGPVTLWIAGEVDMYEVANSMLSVLLHEHKVNDALLFSTILSTDLRALRRRGYNVDRILKQQKAEREAREAAALQQSESRKDKLTTTPGTGSEALPSFPGPAASPPNYVNGNGVDSEKEESRFIRGFKRIIHQHSQSKTTHPTGAPALPPPPNKDPAPVNAPEGENRSVHTESRPLAKPMAPTQGESSPANIHANVHQAIMACKPTNAGLLRNRTEMNMVKESLEEGYCDISGYEKDVTKIGELDGVAIYLATQEVTAQATFMTQHNANLRRFTMIIALLSQVYGVPSRSIHIFYDLSGSLIAFNRDGSLFLNYRYFLAWHETEVAGGNRSNALISWFFTLAHEIAHNLVRPHNAEHEFYFSAICEAHMGKLCNMLTPTPLHGLADMDMALI